MKLKIKLLVLASVLNYCANAQKLSSPVFNDGDKICFVGNSITSNGEFFNNIFLYYATRFPQKNVWFYNCGISGDVTKSVLNRLNDDVFVHRPTWCVVMLGMNDVTRDLYKSTRTSESNIIQQRQAAIDVYKKNLETIVEKLLQSNSKVILEKPTIYDQTAKTNVENYYGVNDALKICADYIQKLADKYQLLTIDYYSLMNEINTQVQLKDSSATITGHDRVHPGPVGHFIMTYEFLKSTGAPQNVSTIAVNNKTRSSNDSRNCIVSDVKYNKNGVTFSCIENSLPFPAIKDASPALALVPFTKNFNQEILKVTKLEKGDYDLIIDTSHVASFNDAELKRGVNLATNVQTPQYSQSLTLLNLCRKYRDVEATLTSLKFLEHYVLADLSVADLKDMNKVTAALDAKRERFKNSSYFMAQFKDYLTNKPQQSNFEMQLADIHQKIYLSNKPVQHTYTLIKKTNL
ncbi:MAG: SGNH/GDSL hydrolase family protein [Bacteroidota bacterium]